MQENWARWGPHYLSPKYYIVAVSDTVRALRIKLINEQETHYIQLIFKGGVDSYERTDETFCLKRTKPVGEKYGLDFYTKWTFFTIYNSEYLRYLSDQSYRFSETINFIHFAILAIDSIMDIIAYEEPKIIIQEKKSKVIKKGVNNAAGTRVKKNMHG